MNYVMVRPRLFWLRAKDLPNYWWNHIQYFKPIFEGGINIQTSNNNKVYRKVEKSHLLTQIASHLKIQCNTTNLLSCEARQPLRHTWFICQTFDLVRLIWNIIRISNSHVLNVAYCYVTFGFYLKLKKKHTMDVDNFRTKCRRKTYLANKYSVLHSCRGTADHSVCQDWNSHFKTLTLLDWVIWKVPWLGCIVGTTWHKLFSENA